MTHTKYPWVVSSKNEVGIISTDGDQTFGMVIPFADFYGDDAKEKAQISCSCVNALAGIADPEAWVKAMKDVHRLTVADGFPVELGHAWLDAKAAEVEE